MGSRRRARTRPTPRLGSMTGRRRTGPAERRTARAGLGRLADARIGAQASRRYRDAALRYVDYLHACRFQLPFDWDEMDLSLQDYLEHLWTDGATKGQAGDTLSGIQHLLRTRRQFPGSWRLLSVWGRLESPSRAPPMLPLVAAALAGWGLVNNEPSFAAAVLSGFHLCLRTMEALGLCSPLLTIGADGRGVVSLPWTKTSARRGARENVTIDDQYVGSLLHWAVSLDPAGRVWPHSAKQFHSLFRRGLEELGCSHMRLSPYSLRRGGATHEYLTSGDLSLVMIRGRWSSARTARIYIEDGAAVIAEMRVPDSLRRRLELFSNQLVSRVTAYARQY